MWELKSATGDVTLCRGSQAEVKAEADRTYRLALSQDDENETAAHLVRDLHITKPDGSHQGISEEGYFGDPLIWIDVDWLAVNDEGNLEAPPASDHGWQRRKIGGHEPRLLILTNMEQQLGPGRSAEAIPGAAAPPERTAGQRRHESGSSRTAAVTRPAAGGTTLPGLRCSTTRPWSSSSCGERMSADLCSLSAAAAVDRMRSMARRWAIVVIHVAASPMAGSNRSASRQTSRRTSWVTSSDWDGS